MWLLHLSSATQNNTPIKHPNTNPLEVQVWCPCCLAYGAVEVLLRHVAPQLVNGKEPEVAELAVLVL